MKRAVHYRNDEEGKLTNSNGSGYRKSFIVYSLLFPLLFLVSCAWLLFSQEGYLWVLDGFEQQYPFFVFEGKWLRALVGNIAAGKPSIPMWSEEVGLGFDSYLFAANCLGNPINLISFFSSPKNAELLLYLTIPIELYLSGITFLSYCKYKGFDPSWATVGALVFAFCGFSSLCFYQILMLYPLVLGPLVLKGSDYIFDDKSPLLLSCSMALTFLYSVQVGWMVCLALLPYCLLRVFLDEGRSLGRFFSLLLRFLICIAVGFLCSAITFVPVAMNILSQERLTLDRQVHLLYELKYYISLFCSVTLPTEVGADCVAGSFPLGFLCCGALLASRGDQLEMGKRRWIILITQSVFMLTLLLPVAGRVSNGFAYPNNRWVWIASLVDALAVTIVMPRLASVDPAEVLRLAFPSLAYAVASVLIASLFTMVPKVFFVCLAILLLLVSGVALLGQRKRLCWIFCVCMLFIWVGCVYSYRGDLREHIELGSAYSRTFDYNPSTIAAEAMEKGKGWRCEEFGNSQRNDGAVTGVPGTSFYCSYYNEALNQFMTTMGIPSASFSFNLNGLNGQTTIDALCGVKYAVAGKGNACMVSSLYREVLEREVSGKFYTLYETDQVLPLGCIYDNSLSEVEFERLSDGEKRLALLKAVVLNEGEGSEVSVDGAQSEQFEYQGSLLPSSDGEIEYASTKDSLSLVSSFSKGREYYLVIHGFDFKPESRNAGKRATIKSVLDASIDEDIDKVYISITAGEKTQRVSYHTRSNTLYGAKDSFVVRLPNLEGEQEVSISFDQKGTYCFEELSLQSIDLAAASELIDGLSANGYSQLSTGSNTYDFSFVVPRDHCYAYFRLPFSSGWSATVDGAPATVMRANYGFLVVPVDKGNHDIVLTYETPGLRVGAALSVLGVMLLLVVGWKGKDNAKG